MGIEMVEYLFLVVAGVTVVVAVELMFELGRQF